MTPRPNALWVIFQDGDGKCWYQTVYAVFESIYSYSNSLFLFPQGSLAFIADYEDDDNEAEDET